MLKKLIFYYFNSITTIVLGLYAQASPLTSWTKHKALGEQMDSVSALVWVPQKNSTGDYRFELGIEGTVDTTGEPNYEYLVHSIRIIYKKTDQLHQEIRGIDAQPTFNPYDALEVQDCNFDGYPDLLLMQFLPAGPNIPYSFWIYNPKRTLFELNADLEQVTSPTFDTKRKCIVSYWRDGAANHGKDTYRWIDGKLVLVEQEQIMADPDGNEHKNIYTKARLIKGKLKIVKREIRRKYKL